MTSFQNVNGHVWDFVSHALRSQKLILIVNFFSSSASMLHSIWLRIDKRNTNNIADDCCNDLLYRDIDVIFGWIWKIESVMTLIQSLLFRIFSTWIVGIVFGIIGETSAFIYKGQLRLKRIHSWCLTRALLYWSSEEWAQSSSKNSSAKLIYSNLKGKKSMKKFKIWIC